jgi:hypothetical protein
MSRRVTIMIDDEQDKKIRNYQAKMITNLGTSYSYSQAIHDKLKRGLAH